MEKKKGSFTIVFLIIAINLIIVMGALLYRQKKEADRQIAELENNASKLQETIDDLQGKIDTISNTINGTTEEIKSDMIIELNEIESLDYSNKSQLQSFHSKYEGKTVKITGYVRNIEDNVIVTSVDTAETVVHIGNSTNDEKWIVSGTAADLNIRKQINNLKLGQKISIVGVINNDTQPIELNDIKIIEEQADAISDNTYSIEKIIMWTPNTTSYDFNTKQWLPNDTAEYYVATDKDNKLCIVDREKNLVKKFDIVITDLITSAYVAEWEKTLTIIQKDATAYDINITDFTYRQYQYASGY